VAKGIQTKEQRTGAERSRREQMLELYKQSPIPDDETLGNLGLFIPKTEMSRLLYIGELYRRVLDVHGVIMEFGVRWGHNMALFEAFRGIYEPFNWVRKIVGFDTFEGFRAVSEKDGPADIIEEGSFAVTEKYEEYLEQLMTLREAEGVQLDLKRFELVKGDASKTVPEYLEQHPETIVSLAYFDLDIYQPTRDCLEAIRGHLTKGSVVAFDELNHRDFPGETLALKEVFGLDRYKLVHSPYSSARAYFVHD
jgi:hypothetical protein